LEWGARKRAAPAAREQEVTMNWKLMGLSTILAGFSAFTAYVVWQYGYVGLFERALADAATIQLSLDLVIALSVALLWIVRDARERGIGVAPYVVATVFLGSIGPLLYLVGRERRQSVAAARNLNLGAA
jgi:hypothetical protein